MAVPFNSNSSTFFELPDGAFYTKAELSGITATPCFRLRSASRKCLLIWTLPQVLLTQILIKLTSFMGIPNSMLMLHNTYLLTEPYIGFLHDYKQLMYSHFSPHTFPICIFTKSTLEHAGHGIKKKQYTAFPKYA
jgi:hypothetical protein